LSCGDGALEVPYGSKVGWPFQVKGVGDLLGGAPDATCPRYRQRRRDAVGRQNEVP
jgi:hypothetical protein